MNDVQANLILQGDSSGAVKALNETNSSTLKLDKSIAQIDKHSAQFVDAKIKQFRQLEKQISATDREWQELDKALGVDGAGGAGSMSDRTENVKEFGGVLGDLASGFAALEGGGIGALASIENFANAMLGLRGASAATLAAMAPLLAAGAAIGAALGGAALAFSHFSAQAEASQGHLRDIIGMSDDYFQLMLTGTQGMVQDAIDAQNAALELAKIQREVIEESLAPYKELKDNPIDRALNAPVFELYDELNRLNSEIAMSERVVEKYAEMMNDSGVIARTAAENLEKLADEETKLNEERTKHLATAGDLYLQMLDLEDAYEDRIGQENKLLELQKERQAEDEALTASYEEQKAALDELYGAQDEAAKQAERQATLQSKLADLQAKSAGTIAKLETDTLNKRTETAEKLADLEDDYQKNALKRARDFEQKRKDIEDAFNLTRLQAFASQDAASLFFATLGKEASLAGLDSDQAQADQEAQEAFEERRAEIAKELEAFKAAQDEKIALEKSNLEKSLKAEKDAFDEQQRLEEEADQKRRERAIAYQELEDRIAVDRQRLAEQRAQEDLETRREAERVALQEQLEAIAIKRDAELAAVMDIVGALGGVQFERDLIQGNAPTFTAIPKLQFARGGVFMEPTRLNNALIAEDGPEAIVPLNQLGGGTSMSMPISITVQGDASEQTVRLIEDAVKREGMNIIRAVSDSYRLQGRPK